MKYFAKLSLENIVLSIHKVEDSNASTEQAGSEYLTNIHNWSSWKECSKTNVNVIRKNPAKIGDTYDVDKDAFISPKPFNSWVLNETTCQWEPPVEKPATESYSVSGSNETFTAVPQWNEDNQRWEKQKVLSIKPTTLQDQHWDGTNWIVS